MTFELIKCHGSENDFVMIDEVSRPSGFSEADRAPLARALCDRQGPAGADGVLFFLPSRQGAGMMRMFNPDGSEAEMCGNGIRCIGRLAHEVLGQPAFRIETLKGCYAMQAEEPLWPGVPTYSVAIDTVSLRPADLPLSSAFEPHIGQPVPGVSGSLALTALSLTNPHAIALVEAVRLPELEEVGRKANAPGSPFAKGVNVTFCQVLGPQHIYTGTYERGAGITCACGTGMSAATVAAFLHGRVPLGVWVDVHNAGGMVRCKVEQDEASGRLSVHLLGNATYLYRAQANWAEGALSLSARQDFWEETEAYRALKASVQANIS
jgi:diaminopimelate epimerase